MSIDAAAWNEKRGTWTARIDPSWAIPLLIAVVVVYLTIVPLGMMILSSFQSRETGALSFGNYARIYTSPVAHGLLLTSLLFAVGSSLLGTAVGALLAWFVERTDMPWRRFFFIAALAPLIIPGSLSTFAWVLLLSPTIGLINVVGMSLFGLAEAPFNGYTLGGMIWVEGMHLSSLAFLLVAGSLKSMDATLEDSAFTSGAGVLQTVRRITVPLLLPAIASTLLISFVRAVEAFEVPAMVGLPGKVYVLASQIYLALNTFPVDHGLVGTFSTALFIISGAGVLLYSRMIARGGFTTITGKAYRPRLMELGPYRYLALGLCLLYVSLLIGLPTLILVWSSLLPYYSAPSPEALQFVTLQNYPQVFADPVVGNATRNSLVLAISTATITVLATSVIAWITIRTRLPGRQLLDILAFLPIAIPGLVLAVALITLYAALPIGIYGSLFLLTIAYVTRFLPYGMRACSASVVQVHQELEEAAAIAGASWLQTFRRVLLPLLQPGMFAAWVYILIVSSRELSSSVLLAGPNNMVIAVLIFSLYNNGRYTAVAALGVMMILALSLLVFLFQRLGGRAGVHREGT